MSGATCWPRGSTAACIASSGSFYSVDMLPGISRTIALFNPVVYLMSVFRWSFFDTADVPILASLLAIVLFTALCLAVVWWIFRSGWRIRQ